MPDALDKLVQKHDASKAGKFSSALPERRAGKRYACVKCWADGGRKADASPTARYHVDRCERCGGDVVEVRT